MKVSEDEWMNEFAVHDDCKWSSEFWQVMAKAASDMCEEMMIA